MKPSLFKMKRPNIQTGIYGWEDCCPLCGNVNITTNTCGVCGYKWKKGYVYYSDTSIADWKSGSGYIDLKQTK